MYDYFYLHISTYILHIIIYYTLYIVIQVYIVHHILYNIMYIIYISTCIYIKHLYILSILLFKQSKQLLEPDTKLANKGSTLAIVPHSTVQAQ